VAPQMHNCECGALVESYAENGECVKEFVDIHIPKASIFFTTYKFYWIQPVLLEVEHQKHRQSNEFSFM